MDVSCLGKYISKTYNSKTVFQLGIADGTNGIKSIDFNL